MSSGKGREHVQDMDGTCMREAVGASWCQRPRNINLFSSLIKLFHVCVCVCVCVCYYKAVRVGGEESGGHVL